MGEKKYMRRKTAKHLTNWSKSVVSGRDDSMKTGVLGFLMYLDILGKDL